MSTLCIFTIIILSCQASYDSISSSVELPAECDASAAGYDDENDIILIFGGYPQTQQFIQFKNNEFIYYDPSYLSFSQRIMGFGHKYFQLNNTLWMISQRGTYFVTANTHSPYDISIPDITIPMTVSESGCLAMANNHIFIVGGSDTTGCDPHAHVQIYDTMSGQWLSDVPSLPSPRMSIACYAVDDTLYAIGGGSDNCQRRHDTILMLDVSDAALADISSQQWQLAPGTMNTASSALCVVKYRDDLILIGGYDIDQNPVDDVNVINTLTGDCVLAGTLSTATDASVCVINPSNNILYIFGGDFETKNWQFINLPTLEPTAEPTVKPTASTNGPTQFPTLFPTADPTSVPTANPTSDPTISPTQNPTKNPTRHPSIGPSTKPTFAPTNIPTVAEYLSTDQTVHDTIGPVENINSAKHDPEFVIDDLAIGLIVLCATLCLIIVVVVVIGGISKIKEVNEPKHSISALDNDVTIGENNTDNAPPKLAESAANVTTGAMIEDKIFLRVVSTENTVVMEEGVEEGEEDGVELVNVVEESSSSSSNESLYDNQPTAKNGDVSGEEEGVQINNITE